MGHLRGRTSKGPGRPHWERKRKRKRKGTLLGSEITQVHAGMAGNLQRIWVFLEEAFLG